VLGDPDARLVWRDERSALLRGSRELLARSTASSTRMRSQAHAQQGRLAEQRRRWDETLSGDVRIERLWPHLHCPASLPVRQELPVGLGASILLCGICDEPLATGTYAADLDVTLRCTACNGYNTGYDTGSDTDSPAL
jgi:hypothetical protein